MSKLVKLTWRSGKKTVVENCYLLDEDDKFFYQNSQGEDTEMEFNIFDDFAKKGLVLFEERTGVFGLEPKQIISIEPILEV